MPDELVVRAYNVHFGDALFVEVPDKDPATGVTTLRRILIDVGNSLNKEGGDDAMFQPAVDDILARLNGDPLDLYVMTHEHLDHVQGLFYYASEVAGGGTLQQRLKPRQVWLTGSADPTYYDTHDRARRELALMRLVLASIRAFVSLHPEENTTPVRSLLANNDFRSTDPCVAYLRSLNAAPSYVHRGMAPPHPFQEARFEILAPEEDTADYYGRFRPALLQIAAGAAEGQPVGAEPPPLPPPGVDAGAFYHLVNVRSQGFLDALLAIDKAANNTSVVFSLEWRGWRLLFTGDAEIRSWKTMKREGVLKPVHFLKVSHHSSENGTPIDEILDLVLPAAPPDARPRRALVSTWRDTYNGIPHPPTLARLATRCQEVVTTLDHEHDLFVEMKFPG